MFGGIRSGKAEMTCDTSQRHVSTASARSRPPGDEARCMETGDRIVGKFRGKPGGAGSSPLSTDSDLVD